MEFVQQSPTSSRTTAHLSGDGLSKAEGTPKYAAPINDTYIIKQMHLSWTKLFSNDA